MIRGVVLILALVACHRSPEVQTNVMAQRQAALNLISGRCGVPRSSWRLLNETKVTLEVPPDTSFENADCLLREYRKANLPLELGFVGHESYPENAQ